MSLQIYVCWGQRCFIRYKQFLDIYDDNALDKICDDCKNYYDLEIDDNGTSEEEQSKENTTNNQNSEQSTEEVQ